MRFIKPLLVLRHVSRSIAIDLTALSSLRLRGLSRNFFWTETIDDRCTMPLAHWILGVAKQFSALVLGFPLFLPSEPIRQLRNQFWKSAPVHSCSYRRTLTHPANLPPARPPALPRGDLPATMLRNGCQCLHCFIHTAFRTSLLANHTLNTLRIAV